MSKIMYKGISYANAGVSSDATSIPIADTVAEFDSTAHMNSTDMTSQEIEDFVDSLDIFPKVDVQTFGYSAFTYSADISPYATSDSDNNTPKAYKYGRVVMLAGAFKNTAQLSTGEVTIGKVPNGCEPICKQFHSISQGSSINRFLLKIFENGNIVVERYGTTEVTTIPANSWLNLSCTYISAS